MEALIRDFRSAMTDVRDTGVTLQESEEIARRVIGWPQLTEKPTAAQQADQADLDADLHERSGGYFRQLGPNAYATLNLLTDLASRPPRSKRVRRDRPTLERLAGAWLRRFRAEAREPGFSVARHIGGLPGNLSATGRRG
jgi:hypothetical protein